MEILKKRSLLSLLSTIVFSFALMSCSSDDNRDEPKDIPVDVEPADNIENLIVGTWEELDDNGLVRRTITIKGNGVYYDGVYYDGYATDIPTAWDTGYYIITHNSITFTPVSDWTGQAYDIENIDYYRFVWSVEIVNDKLYATDEYGDTSCFIKSNYEPTYEIGTAGNLLIVGHWFRYDTDSESAIEIQATEEWIFYKDGMCEHIRNTMYNLYPEYDTYTYDYYSYSNILTIHLDDHAIWEFEAQADKDKLILKNTSSGNVSEYKRIND